MFVHQRTRKTVFIGSNICISIINESNVLLLDATYSVVPYDDNDSAGRSTPLKTLRKFLVLQHQIQPCTSLLRFKLSFQAVKADAIGLKLKLSIRTSGGRRLTENTNVKFNNSILELAYPV
jgi:hypothetical protein